MVEDTDVDSAFIEGDTVPIRISDIQNAFNRLPRTYQPQLYYGTPSQIEEFKKYLVSDE